MDWFGVIVAMGMFMLQFRLMVSTVDSCHLPLQHQLQTMILLKMELHLQMLVVTALAFTQQKIIFYEKALQSDLVSHSQ